MKLPRTFALVVAVLSVAVARLPAQPAALPNVTTRAAEVINLWPGAAPDEPGGVGPERVLPNRPRPFDQIENVTVPTLAVFHPPAEKRTGTGMLVIPGGGLERLAIEHEGFEVAEWLQAQGITAFLLKHRVPPRSREQRWKAGLQDAQRAMSLIRSRAAEWQIDADALGSIGFSAGAEINVMLSTYTAGADRQYARVDAADEFSTRPAFNIAIYGGGFANGRENKMRDDIASRINADTPPMFIVHAFDDAALSSVILMNALKRANVVSELHIFGAGAHGFGVRDSGLPVGEWRALCLNWLRWQGYLDGQTVRTYARDFVRARDGGGAMTRFSAGKEMPDLAQAFAVQHRVVRATLKQGAEITGYKAAYTSAAARSAVGVSHPLHGVLFKQGRLEAAATKTIAHDPKKPVLVETEIGYVMATDIGSKLTVPRQAMTTVEAIVPVIELPTNVAALVEGKVAAVDLVAANGGSNQYIVGAPVAPTDAGDLDALRVSLRRDGQVLHDTTGANVVDGQAKNLMTLINQIIDQGHVIHRGDIIVSGALERAHPGEKGSYAAEFGALGKIEFKIE
jgi:2-keto-4-pentenoate hydratase/acetyl esterase/lipase